MTDDAQATLRRLVALSPEAIEPRETLIGLLVAGKDFDGARQLVADGLTYQPGSPPLLADELRIDLQANGLKTALATADRLQQQNPASDDARALKGDAYMMAKRPDDAAAAYEAALQAAPSALLEERLVDAFKATGHPEKAMQSLRDWMSHHPDDMQTAQTLASLEIDAGQFDDAAAWLETILARRPHDPTVLNNLAWVYQEKGDPKALSLATQAYVLGSSNAETADTLGWILTKQGEAEKGVALLRQASAQLPADPHIAYHLAVALKAVGQREAAIKLLNALVAAPHDFDEKPQAQQLLTELSRS
jgi:tetratricopeptide (TPR) repeat protein